MEIKEGNSNRPAWPHRLRNRKKRMRQAARDAWLDTLYAQQNSLCCWCKSQTVLIRYIPKQSIVEIGNGFVAWKDGDFTFRARIATTDHLHPLCEGGTNDPQNLAMACADCNKDRTRKQSSTPDEIRHVCPVCKGQKH